MKRNVYVDVDDTIVRSVGSKRIPIPTVIQHIRYLNNQGAIMFCRSSGGGEYAKQSAREFEIADCFDAFLPKPNIMLDDQAIASWKRYACVPPSACASKTLESCEADLG